MLFPHTRVPRSLFFLPRLRTTPPSLKEELVQSHTFELPLFGARWGGLRVLPLLS